MPGMVWVDNSQGLIRISLHGSVVDSDLVNVSRAVRAEPALAAGLPVLYDCSDATEIRLSAELVRTLGTGARADSNRVAFVAPSPTAFGLARMYQIVSDTGTDRIQVFSSLDEAVAWLAKE